jgi:hypothetical protein
MTRLISIIAVFLFASLNVSSQIISNDAIREKIRNAGAQKTITIAYDAESKTSKLMAVSDNFSKGESSQAGLLAMNFAIGIVYPGDELVGTPETFLFTFWAMARKPRFGANHAMTAALKEEMLVIGSARYASKPAQQMEYLNFEISRENLSKIAAERNIRFHLGDEQFTFTDSQLRLLADVLSVTQP